MIQYLPHGHSEETQYHPKRESQDALECWVTTQGPSASGSFSKFVNVMSARTAVGHDRKGQLVLFHADGQTEQRG